MTAGLRAALLARACIVAAQGMPGVAEAGDPGQRSSGNAFLTPALRALAGDPDRNPLTLLVERGRALWQEPAPAGGCEACHGPIERMRDAAPTFPRLSADGQALRNLEDQVVACRARAGGTANRLEDDDVIALSAALHDVARGRPIAVAPPAGQDALWKTHLDNGARQFATRIGRMNLACVHCHEQKVGARMLADVVSQGHPTGFPIYRMSWEAAGSIDRRLRACFSGVQAQVPSQGSALLRDLELFLKVRANGMPLDGPSIRR